jgi:hypothetical protein
MFTYRITYLLGKLETSTCPPAVAYALFNNFDGSQQVALNENELLITFETEQTPNDLGKLVKVELLPTN